MSFARELASLMVMMMVNDDACICKDATYKDDEKLIRHDIGVMRYCKTQQLQIEKEFGQVNTKKLNNHLDTFVFPDLFLDKQTNRTFSQYFILFFCTTCFDHQALITCVLQLGRIHIHNTRSESEFCINTRLK